MSRPSYLGANVISTDSFAGWIDKTNQVRHDMGTVVVTVGDVPQPNSTNGAETSGNSHIEGILSAATMAVPGELRGGTVSVPATLFVTSNVTFSDSETIQIDANTNTFSIDANNTVISSNLVFDGITKTIDISSNGLTILVGDVQINPDTTISGDVTLDGSTLTATTNTTFTAETHTILGANTTIGANNTSYVLVVNADSTLANTTINDLFTANANTVFTGALNTFNNNVVLGSDGTDSLSINAKVDTDIVPSGTVDVGTETDPFTEFHGIDAYIDNDVEAKGEFRIRSGSIGSIRHKSTTTGYQDVAFNLETSTGSVKTPVVVYANSSASGIKAGANTTHDLGSIGEWWRIGYVANVESDYIHVAENLSVDGNTAIIGDSTVSGSSNLQDVIVGTTLDVTGDATFDGDVSLNANTVIGSSSADTIAVQAEFTSGLIPDVTNTVDLGSASKFWANAYVTNITANTITVTSDLDVDGTSDLDVVNVTETLDVSGVATFNANVTIGSDSTDKIDILGNINSDIIPEATSNLGDASNKFAGTYTELLQVGDVATFDSRIDMFGSSDRTIRVQSDDASQRSLEFQLRNSTGTIITPLTISQLGPVPGTHLTFDLGTNVNKWRRLYVANVEATEVNTTNVTASNDVFVSGDLTVLGSTTLSSNTTLSLETSNIEELDVLNTLTMTGSAGVDSNLPPKTTDTYDLGTPSLRWETVYANTLEGDLDWSFIQDVPDPQITVNMTGDVSGSGSATLTDLANGTINIATTIQSNSVTLGTDTTGNYVASLTSGSGVTITGGSGEGSTPVVEHANTSTVVDFTVDNSDGTVIQDITLEFDAFGHVTSRTFNSVNLDTRYAQNVYQNIQTDSGTSTASSVTDTLQILGGSGISTSAIGDVVTIVSNDTLNSIAQRGATTSEALTVGALTVNGDLDVQGDINRISTNELTIEDTFIVLNSAYTGDADVTGVNAGIKVERGQDADRELRWNETTNRWEFQHSDGSYYNLPVPSEYSTYSWDLTVGGTDRGSITEGERVSFAAGSDMSVAYSATNNLITFSHGNTSSLNGAYGQTGAANGTYIKSVTVDDNGHLTAVTTDDFDTRYLLSGAKAADTNLLDGLDSSSFIRADTNDNITGHTEWQDTYAVRFGTSADMRIHHTSDVNYIDLYTGDLKIRGNIAERVTITRTTGDITTIGDIFAVDGMFTGEVSGTSADISGDITVTGTVDGRNIASDGTKLDGIETGATADQTANEILTLIKTVDGPGSGLNADNLDGISSAAFMRSDANDSVTANTEWQDGKQAQFGNASDLRIYHNVESYLDNHTSSLNIRQLVNGGGINISGNDSGGTERQAILASGEFTRISHGGSTRITTTDEGVDLEGYAVVGRDSGSVALTTNDGYGNANITFNHIAGTPDNASVTQCAGRISVNTDENDAEMTFGLSDSTFQGFSTSADTYMTLTTSGLIINGDINAVSDQRLKENISPIESALSKVSNMRGVEFNMIGSDKRKVGVIAQEMEKIVPEAVTTAKNDIKSVDYGSLVGVLIEAIKELKEEIEELKSSK